jgi:hypothetical protein
LNNGFQPFVSKKKKRTSKITKRSACFSFNELTVDAQNAFPEALAPVLKYFKAVYAAAINATG